MTKLRNNQTGFSVVEAFLILVIVGLIGSVGWYVLNAQKNTDKDLAVTNTTTPVIKKKTVPATVVKKFPELGIQMTVPVSLQNLVYTTRGGTYDNGVKFIGADITTTELNEPAPGCGADGIGALFRSDGTAPAKQETETSQPAATKQFASFAISFAKGNGIVCDSPKYSALFSDFSKSFSTVQEIK